jgi:regulator of protease activity HflC (stomatin/prohibitin superfamily)
MEVNDMAMTTIMEWQRGLLFTDGRFTRELPPGRHRYRRRRTHLHVLDVRPRTIVVSGQELLTADSVTLRVSTVATWRISQPLAFLTASADTGQELYTAVQLAIRDAVAALTFDEVLADRGRLSAGLAEAAAPRVAEHGIELLSATVKDLMLPGELRRAATETLLARESGKADLERARAEAAALRTLANAARLIEEHPALLHLRTIQAAATPGATVVLTPDPSLRTPS